ncbi:MAG: hypothetical protein E6I47_00100 [Chloroflexi bacterium]|nr:MAG: hypothetical protein E6I47_00100 [Chloroflexota bacterium]
MNLRSTGIAMACVLLAQGWSLSVPPAAPHNSYNFLPPAAYNFPAPLAGEGQGGGFSGIAKAGEETAAYAASAVATAAEHAMQARASVRTVPAPLPHTAMAAPRTSGPITIPVPLYKQTMNLDCETASLQMALAYRGHWYPQSYMFQFEHPDTRPAIKSADGTILQWGNPFTNFVGNVNGAEHTGTGCTIYQALASGHPVQVWVEYQWVRPAVNVWKAWDNAKIHYSLHEHTVVLSGLSDTQVRVNDPWPGTQYWIDKATFERSWADFYNMAIVY